MEMIFTDYALKNFGKIAILYIVFKVLILFHSLLYNKIRIYSHIVDFIKLPYHYINIMFFVMPTKVIQMYMILSNQKHPNYNTIRVTYYAGRRLYKTGYSEKEIENFKIQASKIQDSKTDK